MVIGIEDGFEGLVEDRMHESSNRQVSGILGLGGTILGTSNKGDPWHYPVETACGKIEIQDTSFKARDIKRTDAKQLGGIGAEVAQRIEEGTGLETRVTVLGHL